MMLLWIEAISFVGLLTLLDLLRASAVSSEADLSETSFEVLSEASFEVSGVSRLRGLRGVPFSSGQLALDRPSNFALSE
jgi:hypothetical protein